VERATEEIADLFAGLARRGRPIRGTVCATFSQVPSDVDAGAPIVRALTGALEESGEAVHVEGMTAWTDAALLNAAGIPAICFGPGDITLAHAAEEYVPIDEIERATTVLSRLATQWCR
jgi:acetylornithine deacetylase